MIIANKLKDNNIAEYLLYMWQVEDLLRAHRFDIDHLEESFLSRFGIEDEALRAEVRGWYASLADMMKHENVTDKGHIQINKNIIIMLSDLHTQLLKSPKHPVYSATYYNALPFIVELRSKGGSDDAQQKNEIENCFDAMYGIMMLRLQGRPVSQETERAMKSITQFVALLAEYYRKDKIGEVEF